VSAIFIAMMRIKHQVKASPALLTVLFSHQSHVGRSMVHLHGGHGQHQHQAAGDASLKVANKVAAANTRISVSMHQAGERPPDPNQLLTIDEHVQEVQKLVDWWQDKKQVVCLTGAGLSTESGIPDYRGHQGSYHRGHKPMIHDQFMKHENQRKRYWGRGMVGWRDFYEKTLPNVGHYALAELENMGKLGVAFDDQAAFYEEAAGEDEGDSSLDWALTSGQRRLAVISQNVDALHRRAGSQNLMELHGRLDIVKCTQCGATEDRSVFQSQLEELNREWLDAALEATTRSQDIRPDGDTALNLESYEDVRVPPCTVCNGFVKPHVVFFGDVSVFNFLNCIIPIEWRLTFTFFVFMRVAQSVPTGRVALCNAAIENADGLLVVGSSLAVHSAYRHVRTASKLGISVCILNVGETRAETEKLPGILKIEAPAGSTLAQVVQRLKVRN
jgi:NAD+-dependent protein deacetylase sirtuin 4